MRTIAPGGASRLVMSCLSALLLLGGLRIAQADSFITIAAGDWANPGIWKRTSTQTNANLCPAAGDTAQVNHAITISADIRVGTSGPAGTVAVTVSNNNTTLLGTLTLATGGR